MTAVELAGYVGLQAVDQDGDLVVLAGRRADGVQVRAYTHAADLPTPSLRVLLARQAEATAQVSHRSIATVIELIDLPTRAALVVSAPPGVALARLAPRDLSTVDTLQVVIDLSPALAQLHVHGVGHGSISMHTVHLADGEAFLTNPWRVGTSPTPDDDMVALAHLVEALLFRAGLRVPQGVRTVIGFAHDLARCRDELRSTEMCSPFAPSIDGFALWWRDPVHVLGAESSLAVLAECVLEVQETRRPAVLVVEGPAGAGRSALLGAFDRYLLAHGVLSAGARFSADGTMPLAAPSALVADVVDRLMAGQPGARDGVAAELRARLGDDLPLAVQLAPALESLVGRQPEMPAVAAPQILARAEQAAKGIVGALAGSGRSFVALLDDAECADPSSLAVFESVVALSEPMLVVVARRTDAEAHGLLETLDAMRAAGVPTRTLAIPPLDRSSMHEMIGDGLGLSDGSGAALANALWSRSGGNPGLAISDLHTLLVDGDLQVDPTTASWSWSAMALTERPSAGVAEVALQRVRRVSPAPRLVLQAAAAVAGLLARPTVLAFAIDHSVDTVTAMLDRLSAEQFLDWRGTGVVRFRDDALRRAARDSLDGPTRDSLRVRVARAALAASAHSGADRLQVTDAERFEVLQLIDGHELALGTADAVMWTDWCDLAAKAAHRSGAYATALDLQLRAIGSLGPMGWSVEADRMFELHVRAAENALVVGRATLVDQLLDTAWAHQPTAAQRVRAMRLLGNRWWTRQDQSGGLAEIQSTVRELGEQVPSRPTFPLVAREYLATRRALRGRSPESFVDAPPLTDERVRAVLDTMLGGVHLAYTTEPMTHVWMVLRGMRLTAQHGVGPSSSYFVAGYGLLLCGLGRDLRRGIGFGRAGSALADAAGGDVRTMVCFAHNGFIRHWGEPLFHTIEPLLGEYRSGLAAGRGGYAHSGGTFAVLHSLLSSRPLPRVDDLAAGLVRDLERLGEGAFAQRVKLVGQAVADLRDGLGDRSPIGGDQFDAAAWAAAKPRRGEFALMVHTVQAMVALVHGQATTAATAVRLATPHVRTAPGEAIVGVHLFQLAILHQLGDNVSARAARRARRRLRRAAETNPHEFAHRVQFVDALAAGGGEALELAAATARQNDALADLCIIAVIASSRTDDPEARARWSTMARSAMRAWGAEGALASLP